MRCVSTSVEFQAVSPEGVGSFGTDSRTEDSTVVLSAVLDLTAWMKAQCFKNSCTVAHKAVPHISDTGMFLSNVVDVAFDIVLSLEEDENLWSHK